MLKNFLPSSCVCVLILSERLNLRLAERFCVCVLHFVGLTLQCVKINAQLFPTETLMKSAWTHRFNESWACACTVLRVLHRSLCSSSIKPRTWLFMFLKPSKPINPKQWNQNHMNQTHVKKKNQTHQIQQLIKRSNPTNRTDQMDLPSKRNRSNPANPLPINPSTATEFRSTHQTPCRLTHPPPPSSQIKPIKPVTDQPIKPTVDQPIHHHRVPKSRN